MLHAQSLGDGLHTLELYYTAIGSHLFHLLAILYIDVRGPMLLSMFNGKAIPGGRTLTTETLHLWTNLVHTQHPQCAIVRDDFTMTCHDNLWQRLNTEFLHCSDSLVRVHPIEQLIAAFHQQLQLSLRLLYFPGQQLHAGHLRTILQQILERSHDRRLADIFQQAMFVQKEYIVCINRRIFLAIFFKKRFGNRPEMRHILFKTAFTFMT